MNEENPSEEVENALNFGIAYQSVIPVRKETAHRSEMITQLLFGEHYKVIGKSEDQEWLEIEIAFDGYKGWIHSKQHREISAEYYKVLQSMSWPVTKDLVGLVHGQNKVLPVVYGSTLPVFNNGILLLEKESCKFQGEVFYPVKSADFNFLFSVARFYLAAPYLWGGRTPFGVDCSGFVQQVYKVLGYRLPRDAYQQAEVGETVTINNARPGDLAYFHNEAGRVTHVGIICENLNIIHASGEVRIDKLHEKGIYNHDSGSYTHFLHSIKRVF